MTFNRIKKAQQVIANVSLSVLGEDVAVPAGAAGTIVDLQLEASPVLGSTKKRIGSFSDSSLTIDAGTALDTEVAPNTSDSELANGEYWVDYSSGVIHGKKADATVEMTFSYEVAAENTGDGGGEWEIDFSTALEPSSVIKDAPGRLRSSLIRIDSTAATGDYYILFIDADAVPANGAVTLLVAPFKIKHTNGTDSVYALDFGRSGIPSTNGLVMAVSTTEFVLTIAGNVSSSTNRYR